MSGRSRAFTKRQAIGGRLVCDWFLIVFAWFSHSSLRKVRVMIVLDPHDFVDVHKLLNFHAVSHSFRIVFA